MIRHRPGMHNPSSSYSADSTPVILMLQFVDFSKSNKYPCFHLLPSPLGQWPAPSGVSHPKEAGLSSKRVSDWRQGG